MRLNGCVPKPRQGRPGTVGESGQVDLADDLTAPDDAPHHSPDPLFAESVTMSDTEFQQDVSEIFDSVVQSSMRITPEDTDEVRQIVLRVGEPAGHFREGYYIGVLIPGPHPFGNKFHHRYYSIVSAVDAGDGTDLEILVRRCFYIDEVSGEEYPGISSNRLCDAGPRQRFTLTGPYPTPFRIPAERDSNLLMLGTGTGIAPFRAFLRRIYDENRAWDGEIRLYYGARTGTDLLYMNDVNNDLANYYDRGTFQAIQALGGNVLADAADALQDSVEAHAAEILERMRQPKTHVYLAGMKKIAATLDDTLARAIGSRQDWDGLKQRLIEEGRWSELTYH